MNQQPSWNQADRIRQLLSSIGPTLKDDDFSCKVIGPVVRRDNSQIYYAECTAFPKPAAVKLCLEPDTGTPFPASARQQYSALERVFRRMDRDSQFSVPEPYALHEEEGIVALEWVPGVDMSGLLFSWHCSATRALDLLARAGLWLRYFHGANRLPPDRLDMRANLAEIANLEKLQIADNPAFGQALDDLKRYAEPVGEVVLDQSWVHGDFKTDNLIISGVRTVGVDVHVNDDNCVLYDIAPFLNHLELAFMQPSGWRLGLVAKRLCDHFLINYFAGRFDSVVLPLVWMRLFLILPLWCMVEERSASPLRLEALRWCFRRLTRKLGTQLRKSGSAR